MKTIHSMIIALLLAVGAAGAAAQTFTLNTDMAVHTFSLPVRCPSTTAANCNGTGPAANQALLGAGSVFPECDLNYSAECTHPGPPYSSSAVHYVRVTDAATDSGNPNVSFHAQTSQGSGDTVWDYTATRFVLVEAGNTIMPYAFDPNPASPTYLKPTKLYGSVYKLNTQAAAFGKVAPSGGRTVGYFYALQNAANVPGLTGHGSNYVIMAYDFSSTTTAPTVANGKATMLVDLNSAPHCLPAGFVNQAQGLFTVSDDDQTFSTTLGQLSTGNGTGESIIYVWNRSLGCATWRTDTGVITTFSGTTGVPTDQVGGVPVKVNLHESHLFHDGAKVFVSAEAPCITGNTCNSGNNTFLLWAWLTGIPFAGNPSPNPFQTTPIGDNTDCGHGERGYNFSVNKCIWSNSAGPMTFFGRRWDDTGISQLNPKQTSQTCYFLNSATPTICPNDDQHISWANNTNGLDNVPFLSITTGQYAPTPNSPMPDVPFARWGSEIDIWPVTCYPSCTSANVPWRVAHTYTTSNPAHSNSFADSQGVGSWSPVEAYNQMFVLFTSNWQGQLGCTNGTYSPTAMGLGCGANGSYLKVRSDVFIVNVPAGTTIPPPVLGKPVVR